LVKKEGMFLPNLYKQQNYKENQGDLVSIWILEESENQMAFKNISFHIANTEFFNFCEFEID
jgi:hypothetical protein